VNPSPIARRIARDWDRLTVTDLVWLRRQLGWEPVSVFVYELRHQLRPSSLQAAKGEAAIATRGTGSS
jgi:hypothetical protein